MRGLKDYGPRPGSIAEHVGSRRSRGVMYSYIMLRTQISLTPEERALLDAASARTGLSVAALVREAVQVVYGPGRSADDDLARMRRGFGAWKGRRPDGASYVEGLRSGERLARDERR